MEFVVLFLSGSMIGFLSSFLGIGGGSLLVPILYSLYPQLSAPQIISISLGSIFIISLGNTVSYYKKDLTPPTKTIAIFVITCGIGGAIGSQVLYLIDTSMAKKAMACILLLMGVKILFLKSPKGNKENTPSNFSMGFTGLLGSFISSITGLGGGIVFTPIFLNVLKLPIKKVSAYSNLAMTIATFVGVFPHFFLSQNQNAQLFQFSLLNIGFIGNVNLSIIGVLYIGAFFSRKIGIYFNDKASAKVKKIILLIILIGFSGKLFLD